MKKRITALLLCLVMVFSLIPTSVWASELPVEPAKTPTFSDVKVQVKCSADSTHDRTYDLSNEDFRSSSDTWNNPGYGTWHHTIVLNRATLIQQFNADTGTTHTDTTPNADTRITLDWDSANETWVQPSVAVIKCECNGTVEIDPNAPTKDDLKDCLVTVKCINPKVSNGTNCLDCQYGLWGGNSVGQFVKVSDTKYTVTIGAEGFLPGFQKRTGHEHDLYSAKTLTWVLTYEEGKWVANPETPGVDDTILVTHMPEATYDVLKGMKGGIDTRCVNKTTAYTNYGVIAGLVGESAASARVVKNDDGAYILTVSTKNFADSASKHNDRVHDLLTGETANFVLSLSKNDAGKYVWTATPVTDADGICEVAHRVKVTFNQNYTNAPAATEVYCKYNKAVGEDAFPADPSRSGYVFQGWNTKADGTGDAFSNATAVTEDVTVYAQWGQLHPVQLVIYRNGDTSKAYKTVSLDPQLKGTPIDLNDVDIGKYYTGNYEFYGWYDDGLWNIYKANVAAGEDAPAGLTTKTVNGWTNFKCMVYDYENVVYFQTKEAMEAYQADHSKTEGIVKSVKALHGSALPTVDAPEATRAGYTFQYWSREGQSVNVTGQTVNGWTNLYGVWTITPHNIYAYARLNSYFAPLTAAEFEDTITLNADTLKRLGLGSYNRLGFIPIGTFNFDGMPLVDDMYFDDDTLDAVADAATDAIDNRTIDLDTGVSSSTAAKIDWTVLYKTFNEEDMAPGYITDDGEGYQLSGNLDLATVAFNAGRGVDPDDVKNMPAVNYTYEGFGIHDFYFVGNVFDLPENVPTREGYIFKGWSAKRLGDIVVYSDPTTDAGAEGEKLWQPGDSGENGYSITAQGVIFTAQWEKKTYTIAASLYLNDSTSPVMVDSGAYKWTHRYGGKYGDTIDYQPMIDALKARALEVDAANEPYADATKVTLYFPGSDKVFNTAVTTYGQNTARWQEINGGNIAYIKGVATTSYEVIFKDENGNEIETKIVEYGKTVASVDPDDKYGYNFVGWVDQDGNAFTFDNDGNSVTKITHKTVLTAQWAKKVYTIGPDLRINGGETVKAPGKNYSWSPRYSGEYQDVIDYNKVFEDLTAKVEEVDKDNKPSKIEIKLCFPGKTPANTDEGGLFNEVITRFGQKGASWNPGVKNTAYIWGYATTYYDVIFDSNGGTAVDTQKNVQYGTTATKPENPTREGYRFLGWFTEDGKAFDFSTPITKSMTLTAKWEIVNINAYIIPITSDGTQLVGDGFDMALAASTLSRVGLPGYEDEDAVRIHFATFASSAGLADADDYFNTEDGVDPLVAKAAADLKNGLERRFAAGVNEAKADGIMSKTDWRYLHVGELDDEDDTNFLSGNLVFYSARFVTEDSEHVTGMPNAEYTHNAVAVYDYYLDGETITIPNAVPERYGYDFLGWSVKAVPAENDKLLKAGDTVTVDGDVVFTAQWKLKEYTVSFDSEGGTKVDSQIVEHGSTATKPGNPHRNDYTFKGWYLDGKKFDFSTPITGDITLVARWATKTSGGSNSSSDTTTKDNGKTVQSGRTFDGGIALYVGLSVLSATGSALVITKKKRG